MPLLWLLLLLPKQLAELLAELLLLQDRRKIIVVRRHGGRGRDLGLLWLMLHLELGLQWRLGLLAQLVQQIARWKADLSLVDGRLPSCFLLVRLPR